MNKDEKRIFNNQKDEERFLNFFMKAKTARMKLISPNTNFLKYCLFIM